MAGNGANNFPTPPIVEESGHKTTPPRRKWQTGGIPLAYLSVFALLGLLGWGLMKARAGPVASGLAPDFSLTGFDGRKKIVFL